MPDRSLQRRPVAGTGLPGSVYRRRSSGAWYGTAPTGTAGFFRPGHGVRQRGRPQYGRQGQGPEGQGHVPVPARGAAHSQLSSLSCPAASKPLSMHQRVPATSTRVSGEQRCVAYTRQAWHPSTGSVQDRRKRGYRPRSWSSGSARTQTACGGRGVPWPPSRPACGPFCRVPVPFGPAISSLICRIPSACRGEWKPDTTVVPMAPVRMGRGGQPVGLRWDVGPVARPHARACSAFSEEQVEIPRIHFCSFDRHIPVPARVLRPWLTGVLLQAPATRVRGGQSPPTAWFVPRAGP